jgi:hypothetical protein
MKSLLRISSLVSAIFVVALSPLSGRATVSDLTVSTYTLVSSKRVTRTEFEYIYRANVTNSGAVDMLGVTATLTSKSVKTAVVDGSVTFGDVPAGKTVTSSDTFTIRQDRSVPFNPADLVWQIFGDPRATPPLVFSLYPNKNDPLMPEARDQDGNIVDYFVTKDADGLATALTSTVIKTSAGKLSTFLLDTLGRPVTMYAPNGSKYQLD